VSEVQEAEYANPAKATQPVLKAEIDVGVPLQSAEENSLYPTKPEGTDGGLLEQEVDAETPSAPVQESVVHELREIVNHPSGSPLQSPLSQ